ncbi:DUF3576 domain-containing protein [Curvivirga sp.]|uniref:DUF3576 domain-containing protein n=1 Tax=Curvivirga sp. TaxID=2856848 RepID=UPI003B590553
MPKISRFLILATLAAFLASCSGGQPSVPSETDREWDRRQRNGKLLGEEGFSFGGSSSDESSIGGVAVNAFIWRASLDTISFMPLNQVDPFGGVIITDWYSPAEKLNERFKLNVYILSQELRSDGLRVSAFKEVKNAAGQWETVAVSKEFALKIEDSILARARQMRVAALENQE